MHFCFLVLDTPFNTYTQIRENRAHALPIQIFETSDITLKDDTHERRARNVRRAGAVWCNKTAGFEIVHGLLGRIMTVLEVPRVEGGKGEGWWIEGYDGAFSSCFNL
jgi:phenylalanyl-tRNA synthetase beta chain